MLRRVGAWDIPQARGGLQNGIGIDIAHPIGDIVAGIVDLVVVWPFRQHPLSSTSTSAVASTTAVNHDINAQVAKVVGQL